MVLVSREANHMQIVKRVAYFCGFQASCRRELKAQSHNF